MLIAIKGPDEPADLKLSAARLRSQPQLVDLAVVGVEDGAALPVSRTAVGTHALDDRHAAYRLIFSGSLALEAARLALTGVQNLLDVTDQNTIALGDAHMGTRLAGSIIDGLPQPDRAAHCRGSDGQGRKEADGQHAGRHDAARGEARGDK